MSVWDKTTPAGTDNISAGDDRIRELKEALEDALSDNGAFPGSSPATTPIYRPRGGKGTTGARPAAADGGIYFNETTGMIERSNATSYDDVGIGTAATVSGTVLTIATFTEVDLSACDLLNLSAAEKLTMGGSNIASGATPDANTLYPNLIPKAWAVSNSSGTLQDGVNLSISRDGIGVYTCTIAQDMASVNYSVSVTIDENNTSGANGDFYNAVVTDKAVGSFKVRCWNLNLNSGGSDSIDETDLAFSVIVIGDQ